MDGDNEADAPLGNLSSFYIGRRNARSTNRPNSPPTVTLTAGKLKVPAQVYKSTGNANVGTGTGTGSGGGSGAAAAGAPVDSIGNFKTEAAKPMPTPTPSPIEEKRQRLVSKLNPALVALVDRLNDKAAKPGADDAKFVREGKAEIQIWLTDKSELNMARLKELGFEVTIDPKTSKMVIGRMSVEKLAALAELEFVRYVMPTKGK